MAQEPDESPTEVVPGQPATGVRLRTVILAVIASSLVSIGASAAIAAMVLKEGPPGPPGPAGPEGPSGEAEVDPEVVWEAVDGDPDRLNQLIDPAPSDIAGQADDLAGQVDTLSSDMESLRGDLDATQQDLSQLCSDLSVSDAVSSDITSCP